MRSAAFILGWCLGGLSLAMMVPAFYGLAFGERSQALAFMNSSVALFFLAGGLIFALFQDKQQYGRRQQLLIVLATWFLLPLGAAIPFYLAGTSNTVSGAYFEAVSALTTTGFPLSESLLTTPKTIILWRSILQWLGGLLTLLMLSFVIGRIMGAELLGRDTRTIIRSNSGSSLDLENTFTTIVPLYAGLTLTCVILLYLSGIPPFDAFCLALTGLSTGGYMPREGSIALYGSPLAELILAIFMFLGAVSFLWVKALAQGNWNVLNRNREPIWVGGAIIALGLVFTLVALIKGQAASVLLVVHGLTQGIASAASLITTTGFQFASPDQLGLSYLIILVIALVGGGRYSTAGGLKFKRLMTMIDLSGRELHQLIYPHSVHPTIYGNATRDQQVQISILSIFSITILFLVFLLATLSYLGVGLTAALPLVVSALSNFGPAYEMIRVSTPDSLPAISTMGMSAQLVLCFAMVVGRIETLLLLSLFNLTIWRR